MTPNELITTQEAAAMLGVSTDGVLYLVRIGRLQPATPVRPRQTTFFRRADVARLAAERHRKDSRTRHVPSRKPSPPKPEGG